MIRRCDDFEQHLRCFHVKKCLITDRLKRATSAVFPHKEMPHTKQIETCSLYLVVHNGLHRTYFGMYTWQAFVYVPTCFYLFLRLYFVFQVWPRFLHIYMYGGGPSASWQADRLLRYDEQRRARTYRPTSVSTLSFPMRVAKRKGVAAVIVVAASTFY